jgi:hypothetical protein
MTNPFYTLFSLGSQLTSSILSGQVNFPKKSHLDRKYLSEDTTTNTWHGFTHSPLSIAQCVSLSLLWPYLVSSLTSLCSPRTRHILPPLSPPLGCSLAFYLYVINYCPFLVSKVV